MGRKSREKRERREHDDASRPFFTNDITVTPPRRSHPTPVGRPTMPVSRPAQTPPPANHQPAPAPPEPVKETARADTAPVPGLTAALRATGLKGLATAIVAVLVLIYVIWGTIVYNAGPGTGAIHSVPGLFAWIPAVSVVIPGKGGAYLLWKIGLAIGLLGVPVTVFLLLNRGWEQRRKITVGIAALTLVLLMWAAPQTSKWDVNYNSYVRRYDSLLRLQTKQAQLTGQSAQNQNGAQNDDQTRAQALQQEIQARYFAQEASKYKVTVTDKDVAGLYQQNVANSGGEATLKKQLADYLGWTIADYKQDIRQRLIQNHLNQRLAKVYKGEADAANQELKGTKVHVYVHGLKWDAKLHNVQPAK